MFLIHRYCCGHSGLCVFPLTSSHRRRKDSAVTTYPSRCIHIPLTLHMLGIS